MRIFRPVLVVLALSGCACGTSHVIEEDASHVIADAASVALDGSQPELPRCGLPETLVERGDAPFDFDGDHCPDIILGAPDHGDGRGALWLVRGAPAGAPDITLLAEGEAGEHLGEYVVYVDDLDGDGRRDLGTMRASMGPRGPAFAGRWLGTAGGAGALGSAELPSADVDDSFWSAELRQALDLDGDALPAPVIRWDRSCRGSLAGDTSAYLSTGGVIQLSDSGCGWGGGVVSGVVADVDGDLASDFVSIEGDQVRVWSARASQTLDAPAPVLLGALRVVGDVDGDGGDDVAVFTVEGARLLRSGGGVLRLDPSEVDGVPIGDVDCDGHADAIDADDMLLRGTPDGFMATDTSALGRMVGRVDLDGDGCRDQITLGPGVLTGRRSGAGATAWALALPGGLDARVLIVP